jgi:hypothetical protein
MNTETTILVFGDLHGRILPAFRCAIAWAREHRRTLAGILQVGDLGYFPNVAHLDRATIRHAKDDPLELGAVDIVLTNELADSIFDDPLCPPGLWFTGGNHEDFDELERLAQGSGREPEFVVDAYCKVRAIKDGEVARVAGCDVAAVWGIDREGRNARRKVPDRGFIRAKAIDALLTQPPFDVVLMHDSPTDAKWNGYGSDYLATLVEVAQPRFGFFGHFSGDGAECVGDFGRTRVFHMAGFEMHAGKDGHAESGSVGVLTWGDEPRFKYVPDDWLKTFTRHNWKWR